MKTKNILLLAATVLSLGVVACGDDGETTSSGTGGGSTGTGTDTTASSGTGNNTTSSSSGGDGGGPTSSGAGGEGGGTGGTGGEGGSGPPAIPELGPQLERMGRPAVNTATVETFLTLSGGAPGPTTSVIRSSAEDDYNTAVNGSEDAAAFINTMALQLTVLDSLDGECGNSLGWGLLTDAGQCDDSVTGTPLVCYGALATVLNADALWVKTEYESCGIYLGVEADGVPGVLPNTDCGGRRPIDDVIRTTYSVVSGAFDLEDPQIFLFDDEIDPPADLHPDTFPFLAAPYED